MKLISSVATALEVVAHVWMHPANAGARVPAVLRALRFQLVGRLLGKPSYAKVGSSGRILCRLHSNGSSAALYANPPDFDEMNFWRSFLRIDDLFLDIGSNVGSYAIWAGDCGAEVWSFEPDPLAFRELKANIALNRFRIRAVQVALGAITGDMTFTLGLDTTNRLITAKGNNPLATQQVHVTTLDSILGGRCARGAKIDVEGAERLVIEGAAASLLQHQIDVIQIEWNSVCERTLGETRDPVLSLMLEAGYQPFRPRGREIETVELSEQGAYGRDLFFAAPDFAVQLGLT